MKADDAIAGACLVVLLAALGCVFGGAIFWIWTQSVVAFQVAATGVVVGVLALLGILAST